MTTYDIEGAWIDVVFGKLGVRRFDEERPRWVAELEEKARAMYREGWTILGAVHALRAWLAVGTNLPKAAPENANNAAIVPTDSAQTRANAGE